MAKRNLYGRKQNPFKILLYIVAVLLLLGGIAYLVMCSREKKESFQQQIKTMEADETESVAPPREKETETESEAEEQTSASDEKKPICEFGENDKKETDAVTETESETETETESEPVRPGSQGKADPPAECERKRRRGGPVEDKTDKRGIQKGGDRQLSRIFH